MTPVTHGAFVCVCVVEEQVGACLVSSFKKWPSESLLVEIDHRIIYSLFYGHFLFKNQLLHLSRCFLKLKYLRLMVDYTFKTYSSVYHCNYLIRWF